MPTIQEHLAALNRAKAAGDHEAADFIRAQMVEAQRAQDAAEYNPTDGMGTVERLRAGAGRGLMNVARNIGNMTKFVSDEDMADAAAIDRPLLDTTAGKVGNFVGETAAVTLPTMGAAGLLGRGTGLVAQAARTAIGRGVVEGAVQGAITSGPGNRIPGAVIGGVSGAILPAVGAAYNVARRGVAPTAHARRLMREGVTLTPGQMNPAGALNQIEEVAQKVPYFGTMVTAAREKGYHEFQRNVIQEAAPAGMTVHLQDAPEMVAQVGKAFDDAYEFAKGYPMSPKIMRADGPDIPLSDAFKKAVVHRGTMATDEQRAKVGKFVMNELSQLRGRAATSDDLIAMRSSLRAAARGESDKGARDLLKSAERAVTDALDSQLPPEASAALKMTDAQYGKFKIVEDAVYRAKDQAGSFTPAQFSQVVRDAATKADYAKGGGRMRELSRAGVHVFQARQPVTGAQLTTVGPLLAAAYAEPMTVGLPMAAGIAGIYGTATGRKLAAGQTAGQLALRQLNRNVLRTIPKSAREVGAGYARNALVNYAD